MPNATLTLERDVEVCQMIANPLEIIEREHVLQERMCDALEVVADGLPGIFNRALLVTLLAALKNDLGIHVRDEERGLFPLLRKRALPEDNLDRILGQLEAEHSMDQGYAQELIAQFERLSAGEQVENANMLGYMLRGFFETHRRHLLWETAVLMPIARMRLDADDLKVLAGIMIDNRRRAQRAPSSTLFDGF